LTGRNGKKSGRW
ncbi:hypothetical protein ECCB7326_3164, partial [Escherichia coli CB7326]